MSAAFMSLAGAVERIEPGMTLAFGGMTLYRRPVAFALALLNRANPPNDLTLLNFTAGYESDLLVGGGLVRTVRSVYFGLEAFGLAPMFTEAAGQGAITVQEETEASIVMGLRAHTAGVGFMPSTAWVGTDLLRLRPDVKTIDDPYTRETLTAFPRIDIDAVVLHGLAADQQGNVQINNNLGIDLELVYVADTVVVTVESLVEHLQPEEGRTLIPAPGADVIAHVPRGAWPTSCYPLYPIDASELLRYVDACAAGSFGAYLDDLMQRANVTNS